jgi:hypothetical protein
MDYERHTGEFIDIDVQIWIRQGIWETFDETGEKVIVETYSSAPSHVLSFSLSPRLLFLDISH